ncbi:hypothetical protein J6590_074790 [Homalodisca vitripennis]|nr:hypothetical protein J6590_074790 [Homalodisca vitripennis]
MKTQPTSSILDCPESRRGLTQQYDNSVAGRVALGVTTHPEIRVTSDVSRCCHVSADHVIAGTAGGRILSVGFTSCLEER